MKRLTLPSRNTAACGCESKLPTGWKEMGAGNPNPNGKRQTRPLLASRKNSVSLSRPPARQAPPAGSLTSITLELTSRTGQRGSVSVPAPTRNSRVSLLRLLGVPGVSHTPIGFLSTILNHITLLQSPRVWVWPTGAPLCDWLPAPLLHWCQTILAATWPSKELMCSSVQKALFEEEDHVKKLQQKVATLEKRNKQLRDRVKKVKRSLRQARKNGRHLELVNQKLSEKLAAAAGAVPHINALGQEPPAATYLRG
uniref:coiled-coil domain-containing protein 3 isoform X3 n=1 Tax=Panthera onca TaxID=9690 RepID=UPI002954CF3F|nr:coiled-coil domain-containing protein 3 isoform X3 [Panthera onca]